MSGWRTPAGGPPRCTRAKAKDFCRALESRDLFPSVLRPLPRKMPPAAAGNLQAICRQRTRQMAIHGCFSLCLRYSRNCRNILS